MRVNPETGDSLALEQARSGSSYRPEIDGLRTLAVLAVIVNHFNKDILPGGFLGVDVFFVISGYVITSSLARKSAQYDGIRAFLLDFYARRVQRLVPSLIVCVLVTSLLISMLNPDPGRMINTGVFALFGFSNITLYGQSTDYFGLTADLNVFTHTWSLGVEEQFYLIFPWLIWFSRFGRGSPRRRPLLLWWISPLVVASLVLFLYLRESDPAAAFFLLPPRFWELGAGVLVYLALERQAAPFLARWAPPLPLVGLLMGVFLLPQSMITVTTIASVVLTSLLLATLRPTTSAFRWLTHPRVLALGLMSYSLYLWHWSVLAISRWSVGVHWWTVPFQVLAILALAHGSFRWIETPLRHQSWGSRRWQTLWVGLGLLAGSALSLVLLGGPLKGVLYAGNREVARDASFARATTAEDTTITERNCERLKPATYQLCVVPAAGPHKPTILVMGDSHAQHLFPALGALRQREGVGLQAFAPGGGSFPPFVDRSRWTDKNIQSWEFFQRQSASLKPGDVVVLSSYLRVAFPMDEASGARDDPRLKAWADAVARMGREMASKGVEVVVVLPLPAFAPPEVSYPTDACLPTWFRPRPPDGCALHFQTPRPPQRESSDRLKRALTAALGNESNVHLFDPFDHYCPVDQSTCRSVLEGVQMFRDDNHLSYDGSLHLLDPLKRFLFTRARR